MKGIEMSENKHTPEPFGYFKAEPFGWTDCAETDDGAVPLYERKDIEALMKQRDELLAALERITDVFANIGLTSGIYDDEQNALDQALRTIASVRGAA